MSSWELADEELTDESTTRANKTFRIAMYLCNQIVPVGYIPVNLGLKHSSLQLEASS